MVTGLIGHSIKPLTGDDVTFDWLSLPVGVALLVKSIVQLIREAQDRNAFVKRHVSTRSDSVVADGSQ